MPSRSLYAIAKFSPVGGGGFVATLPAEVPLGDTADEPNRSRLEVLEDGVQLGPPHSAHSDIGSEGRGRFSHWHDTLYLSASDNSDPRSNGRDYQVFVPAERDPTPDPAPPAKPRRPGQALHKISAFSPAGGNTFSARLPAEVPLGNTADEPNRSRLEVLEDGVQLGPPHSAHSDIGSEGRGRFSHWHDTLYLSASDNSDPRSNGREYLIYSPTLSAFDPRGRAIELLRALPERFSSSMAYDAVEQCMAVLYPKAKMGDDHKLFWQNERFLAIYSKLAGGNFRAFERKHTVYHLVRSLAAIDGHIAECGTFNGSTAYFMALAGEDIGHQRPMHLFDSFEGLSAPAPEDGSFWSAGSLASPEDVARENLARFPDVSFYRGWIPGRFGEVADRSFAFVHIDVDLHAPTRDSIAFFYPRIEPGGILLCDDYGSVVCPGATKAMDDYFRDRPEHVIHLPTMQGFVIKR